jgi:uncharacterized membrane protein
MKCPFCKTGLDRNRISCPGCGAGKDRLTEGQFTVLKKREKEADRNSTFFAIVGIVGIGGGILSILNDWALWLVVLALVVGIIAFIISVAQMLDANNIRYMLTLWKKSA